MQQRRVIVLVLACVTAVAALGLTVNPWPRDGWYQTQYLLAGRFPGQDDYTPIAAPALMYLGAHELAARMGLGLAGEFYVASVLQNVLLLLDACFIHCTLRLLGIGRAAAAISLAFLLLVLSTGLPQCFYSENAALFLMSALVLALARLIHGAACSPAKFWGSAALCGVLVGLLVLTRMTPIVLIPAIALLLLRRFPIRQAAAFTGILAAITALILASAIIGNRARFGRYELTNSSGRHLWQGVKDFSDRALARSPEYQALRRLDPHVQGKYWDKIPPLSPEPPNGEDGPADPREQVLGRLAREAILGSPGLYLRHGALKFVTSIGRAPSPDGFAGLGGWNPLHRRESLPPLLDVMRAPRALGAAIGAADRGIYRAAAWLYPLTLFAIASSGLAAALERLTALVRVGAPGCVVAPGRAAACLRRDTGRRAVLQRVLPLAVFLGIGAVLALIPIAQAGLKRGAAGTLVCLALLLAGAKRLTGALPRWPAHRPAHPPPALQAGPGLSFPCFAALVFFGALWLTWQIEVQATRYTLPYLPLWAILLGWAVTYWRSLRRAVPAGPSAA